MLSFNILREEHHSFERALKVLNKFLLRNDFTVRYFSDFFSLLCELLISHLKKERVLFAHLVLEPDMSEEAVAFFFDTNLLDHRVKEEMTAAQESFLKKKMEEFSLHLEGFILSFSRHIFHQEEGIFRREDSLPEKVDKKVAQLFDDCYQLPQGKKLWDSFLFLLEEMERVVG